MEEIQRFAWEGR